MKLYLKCFAGLVFVLPMLDSVSAQTTTTATAKTTKTKTTAKKAAPTVEGKAITVSLKSLAEANISVFAGKKEDLKTGQLKNFGGLSTNTLYIKENDVVCIMKGRTPVSCADIKPGTTALEVNSSGNVIAKK